MRKCDYCGKEIPKRGYHKNYWSGIPYIVCSDLCEIKIRDWIIGRNVEPPKAPVPRAR